MSTSFLKETAAFGVRLEGSLLYYQDEGKILSATFLFICHITRRDILESDDLDSYVMVLNFTMILCIK